MLSSQFALHIFDLVFSFYLNDFLCQREKLSSEPSVIYLIASEMRERPQPNPGLSASSQSHENNDSGTTPNFSTLCLILKGESLFRRHE